MNSNLLKKIISSIKKRSFYLVLMACVIAITITAVYVTKARLDYLSENTLVDEDSSYEVSVLEDNDEDDFNPIEGKQDEGETDEENNESEVTSIELKEPSRFENKEIAENQNENLRQQEEGENIVKETSETVSAEKLQKKFSIEKIIMPVEGKVIKEFSIDKLLYSKTLDQWCTHNGIDISSPLGNPVKAVGDGVVEDIYTDDMLGITVIVNHGNGYKTKYSNLSSTDMVKKGELVQEGQIINGIGKTSISEKSEESHLHFEIIHNNENIDPIDYLPIASIH